MVGSLKLPKEWLDKAPISNGIIDNTFIAFKTPLDHKYKNKVKELAFEVDSVFDYVRNQQLDLGLWIDLTYTTRYYDIEEVKGKQCRFVKLKCKGRGSIPSTNQIKHFMNECLAYKRRFPYGIIGVHCCHGHNRTGFFIVSYLVQCKNWSLTAAINEFSKIRPPGIYRKKYILELHTRYGIIPHHLCLVNDEKDKNKN